MAEVGINIKVTENMSNVAGNMTNSMKSISSVAEEMKQSLNMKDVMPQYQKFADMVDKFEAMRRANRERDDSRGRTGRSGRGGSDRDFVTQGISDAGTGLRRAGSIAGRMGGGDVMGGMADVAGTVSGMLQKSGPAGAVVGVVAGGLFIVDALTKQYEKQLPTVMELTAQLGRLKGSAEDMSAQFLITMDEVAGSAAKFGNTIEEGMEVYKTLLQTGSRYNIQAQAEEVMGYSRGYGLDRGLLARYAGMGGRFGQGPNAIGYALGGAQQAGLGPARFPEFLQSTLTIFEEGLSRGIVKGFSEINQTQVWLSQLGELFKGQTGLQMYKKMESSVVGATGLGSESDAIMFRAAKRVADREAEKKGLGAATYIDVMKKMEAGITPELFSSVKDIVTGMSANRSDQVELMRQLFGVNYTVADELLGLGGKTGVQKIAERPRIEDTPEVRLMRAQNQIMEDIRRVGYTLIDAKMYALEGAKHVVTGMTDLMGANVKSQKARREYEKWEKGEGKAMEKDVRALEEFGGETRWYETFTLSGGPVKDIQNLIKQSMKKGGASGEAAEKTIQLLDIISGASGGQKSAFAAMGGLRRLKEVGMEHMGKGEMWQDVTWRDMSVVLKELVTMLSKIDTTLLEEKHLELINYVPETSASGGTH